MFKKLFYLILKICLLCLKHAFYFKLACLMEELYQLEITSLEQNIYFRYFWLLVILSVNLFIFKKYSTIYVLLLNVMPKLWMKFSKTLVEKWHFMHDVIWSQWLWTDLKHQLQISGTGLFSEEYVRNSSLKDLLITPVVHSTPDERL